MAERRSLINGLDAPEAPLDPVKAKDFVFGAKVRKAPDEAPAPSTTSVGRTQLSTRIRSDYFEALKNASLQRQIKRQGTSTIIEIIEEAIEPWLKANGYLS